MHMVCGACGHGYEYMFTINFNASIRKGGLPCTVGLCLSWAINTTTQAEEFFNPAFLSGDPAAVADLSRFEKGEGQAPGSYRVETYLNDEYVSTQNLMFEVRQPAPNQVTPAPGAPIDETGLKACITRTQLERLGVNTSNSPLLQNATKDQCVDLAGAIPQASARFDFDNQRLYLSIPQAALKNNARGYVPPEEWDDGITALLLNYDFTGSNTRNREVGGSVDYGFLGLNSGLNLGPWRLRNTSNWNYSNGYGSSTREWQNISTYAQRSIAPLKSELTVGDSYTPSDIFSSLGFRGAQLASDDNMLADSMRGFAPTVRGIANSNAKVTIKQNGYVIYQTYVAPGAFEIGDLYPTSSSGDLKVTVTEANGTENTFTVAYSGVPVLQREGRVKYALTAGQYRSNTNDQGKPSFGQGTVIWGGPHGVTLYGGTQFSNNYSAVALGSGVNLGTWGAVSADVTHANSVLADDSRHQGQSLRFLYAKSLNQLGTNFQLLGYRFSTQGFYTLDETSYRQMSGYTVDTQDGPMQVKPTYQDYYNLNYSRKGRAQVNITQQLGTNGSVFLSGSRQSYWRSDRTDDLWQLGYSARWRDVSYSLTYSYNKSASSTEPADNQLSLNLSFPLGDWLSKGGKGRDITNSNNALYGTYSANSDTRGETTQRAGVSGTALATNNLNYSVQQGYGDQGGASGNANLRYVGAYGNGTAGYSYDRNYQQLNLGVSGGVVAHANGVTFSQPLGDTNVLIKAPGASGVRVENAIGVSTDWRGYTVMPYATTYRTNRVALDTTSLKDDTDLEEPVVNLVPTHGALVRAEFNTRIGVRALVTLLQPDGNPVPFGSSVERADGKGGSIVGDDGQVYLAGLPPTGDLAVRWGAGTRQACRARYQLPTNSGKTVSYVNAECQ